MNIIQGDNGISIYFIAKKDEIENLEGSVVRVAFKNNLKTIVKEATILNPLSAKCQVILSTNDLTETGKYEYQWSIYFADGRIYSGKPTLFTVDELFIATTHEEIEDTIIVPFATIEQLALLQNEVDILEEKIGEGGTGIKGDKGDTGEQGIQGIQGEKGDTGLQGIQGEKGEKGDTGLAGIPGIRGIQGEKGDTGLQGIQGEKGEKGDTGLQGIPGIRGIQGEKGDTGLQGIQGETGLQGIQGIQGEKGDSGSSEPIINNYIFSPASGISGVNFTLEKDTNEIVTFSFALTMTATGANLIVGQLPPECIPNRSAIANIVGYDSLIPITGWVTNDGRLLIKPLTAGSVNVFGSVCFRAYTSEVVI